MHEGHRGRMYAKLVGGENLYDHEILEILLYSACPRVNTNPIAHNLLDRFCSLSEIFKADIEELKRVDGVGDGIANFLKIVGLCSERAGKAEGFARLETFGDCKKFVSMRLRGKTEEFIELYLLEKSGRIIRILIRTSGSRNRAFVNLEEIAKSITLVKPAYLIAAHNHVNCSAEPSDDDDAFTKQLQLICNIHGVDFRDHLIYAGGEVYSYNDAGRLAEIKRDCSLEKMIEWTKNSK